MATSKTVEQLGALVGFKVAAKVSIRRPAEMTDKGRREIAQWLHRVADDLICEGSNYAPDFKSWYWYESKC